MLRPVIVALVLAAACSRAPEPPPTILATPLRERTAVAGPRFTKVDPATSGLVFQNELRPENVVAYVYSGAGVAVGDYDGDGWPDVYMVSQDGPNRLFRQTAPLRFEDVTESAGGLGGGEAWGTAASFADVDNDGDLDLYVCNLESPNLLYINRGDGTFEEKAGPFGLGLIAASMGCAFADYDNDGDLDLYVLTNRVLKHRLPDEIVAGITLPKAMRKTKAELLPPYPSFTRDERGDLVVPKGYEDHFFTLPGSPAPFQAGQCDRLFRNDGYANWVDVTKEAGIADRGNGLSVVWWDFDGDGRLDLYVANDFQSPDQLYHNRGYGRFVDVTKERLPHTAFFGMGADFGDIDGDGRADLCVADMSSTSHYWGKMLMGSMDQHRWFLMNARPQQYMRNALYVNTGTERFLEAAHQAGLASSDWTWSVRLCDLDDDGRLDFFATNGIPVFTDNPDIGEQFSRLWQQGEQKRAIELFRAIPSVAERNVARRNTGDLQFTDMGAVWGLDESSVAHGAVVCDLDRDGDLDVITNNLNAPCSLFENRGADAHRILVELQGVQSNRRGVGASIAVTAGGTTQTALVSPTRGYMSAGEPVTHFGLGNATTIDRLTVRWPSGVVQTFAALAVDQRYTIREAAASATVAEPPVPTVPATMFVGGELPVRHVERDFDDFVAQPLLPHRLSRLGPGLASGDVDGDGRDELWIGGAAGQAGTLLRIGADGRHVPIDGPWSEHAECEDMGACFIDFDGDGDLDLYLASGGIETEEGSEALRDRLYVNDGKGAFTVARAGVLPDTATSSSCVTAADFDRDGDLDLFVGGRIEPGRFPRAPDSRLLRNDGGRFIDVTDALLPALRDVGMVTAAVWSDLDGDGFQDLVVAGQWWPLRVFRNDAGKGFVDRTKELGLDAVRGQWNSLATADLDGDGDLDLVAGNLGLNTKYKASAEKPLRLFARDFDDNGTLDVIEGKQTADGVLPVRGLSCSSQAMPFVREKFPTYDAFARANLAQIYGDDRLSTSYALVCNELQHVVFDNRGDRFVAVPLPTRAQLAPVFGIGIADFDGDGLQDLVLAQNFFSPEPETGRFDGGLGVLLRGRGALQFEAVAADRSGMVMPEDGKALLVTDLDGDGAPDFVAATNDGPVRTFVNSGAAALAVRLRGPAGNPTGVGASVELVTKSGHTQRRELTAGSGYLTQGPAVAWFGPAPGGAVLRVRWPDGVVSERPLEVATGVVVITR